MYLRLSSTRALLLEPVAASTVLVSLLPSNTGTVRSFMQIAQSKVRLPDPEPEFEPEFDVSCFFVSAVAVSRVLLAPGAAEAAVAAVIDAPLLFLRPPLAPEAAPVPASNASAAPTGKLPPSSSMRNKG